MKHNFFIFLIVTLICYGYSGFVRYEQYTAWTGSPAKYFSNETPMMTTLDSYFWLRWAKEYKEGGIPEGRDRLRNFPDGKRSQHPVPLISYLIAKAAPSFDNNYYRTGFFLMMALSGAVLVATYLSHVNCCCSFIGRVSRNKRLKLSRTFI